MRRLERGQEESLMFSPCSTTELVKERQEQRIAEKGALRVCLRLKMTVL